MQPSPRRRPSLPRCPESVTLVTFFLYANTHTTRLKIDSSLIWRFGRVDLAALRRHLHGFQIPFLFESFTASFDGCRADREPLPRPRFNGSPTNLNSRRNRGWLLVRHTASIRLTGSVLRKHPIQARGEGSQGRPLFTQIPILVVVPFLHPPKTCDWRCLRASHCWPAHSLHRARIGARGAYPCRPLRPGAAALRRKL
jgi:hypothetical protein